MVIQKVFKRKELDMSNDNYVPTNLRDIGFSR